jgi:hypothetical protein
MLRDKASNYGRKVMDAFGPWIYTVCCMLRVSQDATYDKPYVGATNDPVLGLPDRAVSVKTL